MENLKKTAILNGLGIIGLLGGTTALVALNILNGWAFVLAAIACYPMVKNLWKLAVYMHYNTIRILRKSLPKTGFTVEDSGWDPKENVARFRGNYRGDNFMIEAAHDDAYVMIYDLPWLNVKASDQNMPKILEAINELNSSASNMSVIMCEPNEEGERMIYTLCRTILPSFRSGQYLAHLFDTMLQRKPALLNAINKERPYMVQRRDPIGFQAVHPAADNPAGECEAPAAQGNAL